MGFSIEQDVNVDVDISINDVIDNLGEFDVYDLEKLGDALKEYMEYDDINTPTTLYDELKRSALNELSEKYSLNEINELIKNKEHEHGIQQ